jgi:hypothetical protein
LTIQTALPPIISPRTRHDHNNENNNTSKNRTMDSRFDTNASFSAPFSSDKFEKKSQSKLDSLLQSKSRKRNLNINQETNKKRYMGSDNETGSDDDVYKDLITATENSDSEIEDLHHFNTTDLTPVKIKNKKILKKKSGFTTPIQFLSDFTVVDAPAAAFDISLLSGICSSILYNFQRYDNNESADIYVNTKIKMERLYLSEKILLTTLSFKEKASNR